MSHMLQEPHVAVLLATFNGERFLRAQLDSLMNQSHRSWTLYWRDDGSRDGTVQILHDFSAVAGQGRCVQVTGPQKRMRPTASFMTLLRAVKDRLAEDDMVAFADQDDVWLPEKLARGVAALRAHMAAHSGRGESVGPALYCAPQMLVDAELRRIGISCRLRRPTVFPAALTQNVTTGCTVMLNRQAVNLMADSEPPSATLHDWWCYLVVTAAGGPVLNDNDPMVLYRQHSNNMVGAPRSMWRRGVAALRRGPSVFMNVLRQHVEALLAQPHLLSEAALAQVRAIDQALSGAWYRRLGVLRHAGLHRQTWQESGLFYLWFLFG
jgi:glycosyltransferase involved in cell wall biosynthesis